eukprot:jgi/Botrbrau1/12935/Bobra.92_1s0015.1
MDGDGDYDEELMFESSGTTMHEPGPASELSDEEKDLRHQEITDDSTSDSDFEYTDKAAGGSRTGSISIGSGEAMETRASLIPGGLLGSGRRRLPVSEPRGVASRPNHLFRQSMGPSATTEFPVGSVSGTASKLGTSMPINIPLMSRNPFNAIDRGDDDEESGKFIPPHLMEQTSGQRNMFATSAISPSTSFRREKLLRRNTILRSTGFIEGGEKPSIVEVLDPIRESMMDRVDASNDRGNPSALSQMLGGSPSPAPTTRHF